MSKTGQGLHLALFFYASIVQCKDDKNSAKQMSDLSKIALSVLICAENCAFFNGCQGRLRDTVFFDSEYLSYFAQYRAVLSAKQKVIPTVDLAGAQKA